MKKLILIGALAAMAAGTTGCASFSKTPHVNNTGGLSDEAMQVVARPIEYGVEEVGDAEGRASYQRILGIFTTGDTVGSGGLLQNIFGRPDSGPLAELASYRAAKSKGGDGFYRVTTETEEFSVPLLFERREIKVTGKALKLKNLGMMSQDRSDALAKAKASGSNLSITAAAGKGGGGFLGLFGN